MLWLGGVYSHEPGRGGVEWCEHAQVTDAYVALLVRRVRVRVRRKWRQMGKWPGVGDAADAGATPDASDGERTGQRDVRGVRGGRGTRDEPFVKSVLCADLDGFSLHAAVRVALGAETSQAPGDVAWRAGTGCESAFMDRAATGGGRWG